MWKQAEGANNSKSVCCTLFCSKFALTAYFSVESVVIYISAFDIVHIPEEEVNDVSAPRAYGRQ
jgi:hypothetical protein